ncbi:MAG: response regulator transcription factor [Opitutaceae bacterium]|nr:response regulator transcription factor [Opitutaceae bacterium]
MNSSEQKFRVMIVEDSKKTSDRLVECFRANCPEIKIVGVATDYPQGLELFRKERPDAALLDIHMPEGNGISLLKHIKKEMPDCLVVMLTNLDFPEFRKECAIHGAEAFFKKSHDFDKIPGFFNGMASMYMTY